MYADRFAPPKRIQPGSLGVAITINGAIFAALVFSAPNVIKTIDPPFITKNIPLPKPPPPEPEPKPKPVDHPLSTQPIPEPQPMLPDPIVKTIPINPISLTPTDPPPVPFDGSGTVKIVEPAPPPAFVDARPDPRYADLFQPIYPAEERRANREGRVVVRVLIGTDGRVKKVERISAASESFFQATMRRALDKWRFKPATRGGVPVESWRTMGLRFQLEDR